MLPRDSCPSAMSNVSKNKLLHTGRCCLNRYQRSTSRLSPSCLTTKYTFEKQRFFCKRRAILGFVSSVTTTLSERVRASITDRDALTFHIYNPITLLVLYSLRINSVRQLIRTAVKAC